MDKLAIFQLIVISTLFHIITMKSPMVNSKAYLLFHFSVGITVFRGARSPLPSDHDDILLL